MIRIVTVVLAVLVLAEAKYLGCFIDKPSRDLSGVFTDLGANNAAHTCRAHCASKAYKFASTQYRTQCACDDNYGDYGQVSEEQCNARCPRENQQSCGGTWRNSVYDTAYLGCWKDSTTRALPVFTDMGGLATVQRCINICKAKGYNYAGIQYSRQCFCGTDYDAYGEVDRSQCSRSCTGNSSQKCGGTWRNSVYRTYACDKC